MSTAHHGPNCVIDHCCYVQLKLLHEIKKNQGIHNNNNNNNLNSVDPTLGKLLRQQQIRCNRQHVSWMHQVWDSTGNQTKDSLLARQAC